ncbi:hypothetical protein M9H77_31088 [Catharanthus roseus]|uniref:Uncharacterized protein n=1 Tax=Catharanthus roseus TaxID=4058 RepID=A0ACC0A013_CATRO|nr:hypothetical protein M9H77_31088 [Catharanthus roseus]
MDGKNERSYSLSMDERRSLLSSISQGWQEYEPISIRNIQNRKRKYPPSHITSMKPSRTKPKAFLVADLKTILHNDVQTPYAAGLLKDLARNLCPEIGQKGSVPHEEITLSHLLIKKPELINHFRQDILLLGGIMKKAQETYWTVYNVDIESKITVSSLALTIFRMKYYDASNWAIYIRNMNKDSFIRCGHYGGHTDVYIAYRENLYYYDINSLYPFIMKEYPMPKEAYVKCPRTIKRPFLRFEQKDETLIFSTLEFVVVYYSKELKYARDLDYTVIPISGYLFEKKESPFKSFVSSLFESHLEAKKSGNNFMSFVCKTIMNSLYGRFGISPKSTKMEIYDENRYKYLLRKPNFIFGELLDENTSVFSYHDEPSLDSLNPMKNVAIQLADAISTSARMYMLYLKGRQLLQRHRLCCACSSTTRKNSIFFCLGQVCARGQDCQRTLFSTEGLFI